MYSRGCLSAAGAQGEGYVEFWRTIITLLDIGGKYMRPYLAMSAYEMFGGTDRQSMVAVAAAQELLHVGMLIHDDIIDRDEVRYGIPNIAGQYRQKYAGKFDQHDTDHHSAMAALLAGDSLLSAAYDIIITSTLPAEDKVRACRILAESVFAVIGGELADTESILQDMGETDSLGIAQHKTALYSFVGPLLSGAVLARAPEDDLGRLQEYGIALGIAFQLADDLIGMFGDEVKTGKSATSDIEGNKHTYLMQQAYQLASEADLADLRRILNKPGVRPEDAERVRNIVKLCGAEAATRDRIVGYAAQAAAALEDLGCAETAKQPLRELLSTATERDR